MNSVNQKAKPPENMVLLDMRNTAINTDNGVIKAFTPKALAEAKQAWLKSTEGRACTNPEIFNHPEYRATHYLEARIEAAFFAGIETAIQMMRADS